jgi:hypothetical protein
MSHPGKVVTAIPVQGGERACLWATFFLSGAKPHWHAPSPMCSAGGNMPLSQSLGITPWA